ncbi:hypothetical protein GALMADRAFT_105450 [Galerina marginata CBS 339.88]|uniref:Sensor domain-containing protein n=1 Tax=Galerina marginata (strain CBS 339.88) TaxID=685588 RepID=A0A067SLX8_GALM3|nr:hypothetical protein GALMADRAFT_105450 [Galerina marginata CBS 339.88]
MAISSEPPSTPPPPLTEVDDAEIADPPPPYPSRERRSRTARTHRGQQGRIHASHHAQASSGDTQDSEDVRISPYTDEDAEPTETTPFLTSSPRHGHHGATGRPRSHSYTSTMSAAPSLAHTVLSLFQTEDETRFGDVVYDGLRDPLIPEEGTGAAPSSQRSRTGFFSRAAWRRYFRPLTVRTYYKSLFHLAAINFPYGLVAWIYLFVFTVTGTTLLVALPLGALLCFFDLLGARAFSRGELALQARFHAPLAHALPYPPRPIFTRYREPTTEELESGQTQLTTRHGLIREKSFYKNTYAMFTDPTSYQALFYFLVIKPAITLLISIGIVGIALPAFVLVLPAPAVLRAIRKIGIWQANVAIEGLYVAVR